MLDVRIMAMDVNETITNLDTAYAWMKYSGDTKGFIIFYDKCRDLGNFIRYCVKYNLAQLSDVGTLGCVLNLKLAKYEKIRSRLHD